jgi:hypothetical protein
VGVVIVIPFIRMFTVMEAAADATPGFELSVAVNVATYEPAEVGVPVRTPVPLRFRPGGRFVADHEYGFFPPLAASGMAGQAMPCTQGIIPLVVTITIGGLTVTV